MLMVYGRRVWRLDKIGEGGSGIWDFRFWSFLVLEKVRDLRRGLE